MAHGKHSVSAYMHRRAWTVAYTDRRLTQAASKQHADLRLDGLDQNLSADVLEQILYVVTNEGVLCNAPQTGQEGTLYQKPRTLPATQKHAGTRQSPVVDLASIISPHHPLPSETLKTRHNLSSSPAHSLTRTNLHDLFLILLEDLLELLDLIALVRHHEVIHRRDLRVLLSR